MTPQWLHDRVFYQIFPERFANGEPSNDPANIADWNQDAPTRDNFFGGDLAGIQQHIPHLQRLGVNALYLTPIFAAGSNHKYDTHDYLKIDPAFGTLESFRQLVAGLKDAQIRLLLDAVFNHCGDGFAPFQDVVKNGENSPYRDWFIVNSLPIRFDPPNYQTCGGAPFLPKLNTHNLDVQAYLLRVTDYWLKEGIDGWRLDVPWKAAPEFWLKFRQQVETKNPDAYLVAEVWRGTDDWLDGSTVHGVMNYRLRQHILDFAALDHMDAEDFDYELRQLLKEHGETTPYHLTLLGSHDTPRIRTICKGDAGRTKIAIVLQMTLPGIPMIYYGDEIGMAGENDPDCRRPMIWDESRWNVSIFETMQALVALRKANPALRCGGLRTLRVFNGVYAYARQHVEDTVIVVANPRMAQPEFRLSDDLVQQSRVWVDALSGRRFVVEDNQITFKPLPAQSALVLIPEGTAS